MFNPQTMGPMENPNIPSVQELWKNEKSKYRHWILLFGIGMLIVLSLYITSFVMNQIEKTSVIDYLKKEYRTVGFEENLLEGKADNAWNTNYLIMPIIIIVMITIGILYYITTVINSYQKKSFAKISQWSTFVIGFGAILSFFQLFSMVWRGKEATFATSGGTFQFINYFIIIAIYFSASIKVSNIRRQFQISEKFEILKNNPQYQNAMQQMMQGQGFTPQNTGIFGPLTKTQQGSSKIVNSDQKSQTTKSKIEKEQQELESMSLADLKTIAKKLSISGFSTMKKLELIKAILRVTAQK